jgi:osmotically-inducible protein OsmY
MRCASDGSSIHGPIIVAESGSGIGGEADSLRLCRNIQTPRRRPPFVLSAAVQRRLRCRPAGRRPTMSAFGDPQRKENHMSVDTDLTADVSDELFWDPRLDSTAVAATADDGKVTLRGTVGSLREKREAKKAAERVFGVISVDNQLQVKLMNDDRRADADLRGDVLQALMLDSLVPKTIDAKVDDGFVTLSGTANWQYQRDEADFVASNIVGALDVFNEIELKHPKPDRGDVQESINKAFKRNAALDADDLHVSTANGSVTLEGTVSSWAEHDEAIDAAWAASVVH